MTVSERISRTVSSVLQTSSLGDANDMLRDSPLEGLDFDLTGDPGGGMVGESIALAEVALCILWGGVKFLLHLASSDDQWVVSLDCASDQTTRDDRFP